MLALGQQCRWSGEQIGEVAWYGMAQVRGLREVRK